MNKNTTLKQNRQVFMLIGDKNRIDCFEKMETDKLLGLP